MKRSWYAEVLSRYVGGTIVDVADDQSDPDSPTVGIVVKMPSGAQTIIWFMGDEEGNFPGVPEIQTLIHLKLNIPHTLDENGNQIKQD